MVNFDPYCLFHFVVVRNDNQISWNAFLSLCNLIFNFVWEGPVTCTVVAILIVNNDDILIIIYLRKTLNRP